MEPGRPPIQGDPPAALSFLNTRIMNDGSCHHTQQLPWFNSFGRIQSRMGNGVLPPSLLVLTLRSYVSPLRSLRHGSRPRRKLSVAHTGEGLRCAFLCLSGDLMAILR